MGTVEEKIFNLSWKPCLNLYSLKWLKASVSLVTRQIRLGLRLLKAEFGVGHMNSRILLLKTEKLSDFLRWGSKLNYDRRKKNSFWKSYVLCLEGEVMYISSRVKRASSRNQAEEIFSIFIFQDLIKKAKFSTPASISKGLQSQLLIDFVLWRTPYCFCQG